MESIIEGIRKLEAERTRYRKKLESFKTYLDTIVIPSVSDITNLKEILEAEG